ncbi:MAG TPA: Flp pilus assembly protein CpaB [Stellaceae bacterium]|jgi:pilus assembly protein CpaB
MRGRTLFLFAIALLLAGGTAMLVHSWLAQRPVVAAAPPPPPQKAILVARVAIGRGQILKPADLAARPWPAAAIGSDYIVAAPAAEKSLASSVARAPFAAGEPIIRAKIVAPGDRGFLAAVLQPGMRAVSVPVDVTADVSGFVMPGDRVDLLLTLPVPQPGAGGNGYQHKAAETVLRDLRVIAIDQRLDSKDGQAALARTVTFEVTPKECEIIAVAAEIGKLSLSLRSLAAADSAKPLPAAAADPIGNRRDDNPRQRDFTLDSDVSQLLARRSGGQNSSDGLVTILRGSGNNGTSVSSQPASRGS